MMTDPMGQQQPRKLGQCLLTIARRRQPVICIGQEVLRLPIVTRD